MGTNSVSTIQATWNGEVIASSDQTIVVEGNHYFPPASVRQELLRPSATQSTCPWKGEARYHSLQVGDDKNPDAAWYYPAPIDAAREIAGYVAFWKGVKIGPAAE